MSVNNSKKLQLPLFLRICGPHPASPQASLFLSVARAERTPTPLYATQGIFSEDALRVASLFLALPVSFLDRDKNTICHFFLKWHSPFRLKRRFRTFDLPSIFAV